MVDGGRCRVVNWEMCEVPKFVLACFGEPLPCNIGLVFEATK